MDTSRSELITDVKEGVGGGLFNEEDGLWWSDADFVPPYQEPNGFLGFVLFF